MSSNELAACPFCGARVQLKRLNAYYFNVECDECRCQIMGYLTAERAIAAWNRRAVEAASPAAPGPEVIEALRVLLILTVDMADWLWVDDGNGEFQAVGENYKHAARVLRAWLQQIERSGGDGS